MAEILPPPLSRMKRRHEYAPVGKCIYCRGDGLPGRLTLEHIIPESLGCGFRRKSPANPR